MEEFGIFLLGMLLLANLGGGANAESANAVRIVRHTLTCVLWLGRLSIEVSTFAMEPAPVSREDTLDEAFQSCMGSINLGILGLTGCVRRPEHLFGGGDLWAQLG